MPTRDLPVRRWLGPIVVVLSVVLLLSLLTMAIYRAKGRANQAASKNNLKQLSVAIYNYHAVYEMLPPGGTFTDDGQGLYGWPVLLLPWVEASPLYSQLDLDKPWSDPHNRRLLSFVHSAYTMLDAAPKRDQTGVGLVHYAANPAVFNRNSHATFDDLLGDRPRPQFREIHPSDLAHVWFIGEAAGDYPPWPSPTNWRPLDAPLNSGPKSYGRPTGDGAQFLMGDGSVRFVSNAGWSNL